jgi:hypothetical protein
MTASNRRRTPGAGGLSPVTVPPVTILMEMAGYGSLTEWLARPLPKGQARQLKKTAEADA